MIKGLFKGFQQSGVKFEFFAQRILYHTSLYFLYIGIFTEVLCKARLWPYLYVFNCKQGIKSLITGPTTCTICKTEEKEAETADVLFHRA